MREYALVLLVTAAVTYLLTPLVRRVAIATRAIHEPRSRDTHTKPTPLLGGLAMYGGLVAGLLLASRLSFVQDPFRTAGSRSQAGLLLAGGLVVLIGFADDRWGLSAISKLAGQVAAAGILVWSGQALPWLPLPNGGVFSLEPDLSVTLTILLVVVTINADEAEQQLGEAVSIYLDGGPCTDNVPSTILDLTGTIPKVLRSGAISVDRLRAVSSVIAENEHYPEEPADVKPAEPHPLETDPVDPATGEPPSVP